jgi:hypothetical protein
MLNLSFKVLMSFARKRACLAFMAITIGVGVAACSIVTAPFDRPTISVSLTVQQPSASAAVLLVSVGGRSVSLRASDTPNRPVETSLKATGFGTFPVTVAVMGSGTDTLATVAFTQKFERGNRYGIGAVLSRSRPAGVCVGTLLAAPLQGSASDTLFVSYTGLPKGAIC